MILWCARWHGAGAGDGCVAAVGAARAAWGGESQAKTNGIVKVAAAKLATTAGRLAAFAATMMTIRA